MSKFTGVHEKLHKYINEVNEHEEIFNLMDELEEKYDFINFITHSNMLGHPVLPFRIDVAVDSVTDIAPVLKDLGISGWHQIRKPNTEESSKRRFYTLGKKDSVDTVIRIEMSFKGTNCVWIGTGRYNTPSEIMELKCSDSGFKSPEVIEEPIVEESIETETK